MSYSKFIFNSEKLLENLKALPTKNVCAVVKANAYGAGVEKVCKTLNSKVRFFAVATLSEALKIRSFDKATPILILGMCENFALAAKHDISVTVENMGQLEYLIKSNFDQIKIHLKINTGMNRYGIKNKKILKKIIKLLKNNKKIIFEGIFTHFYFLKNEFKTKQQLAVFKEYLLIVQKSFSPIVHIGGGGVCEKLEFDDYKNFMVRVGLNLYKNVVSVESKVVKVFVLKRGQNLGYDGGFVANKKVVVAVVPLGYADGINRKLGNNAYVSVNGCLCKIIGNVCMDVFFIDVSDVNCVVGDVVKVFEDAGYWANICDTVPYEILTSLNYSRMKKDDV